MRPDDEITSRQLDELLDHVETIATGHAGQPTEVRLYVTVDVDTLRELEQRAAECGADVSVVAADVLRVATRAA